jgi:hypothetical protein
VRWLWAGALIVVVVSALAGVRYIRSAHQFAYLATQTLLVSALPPTTGGAFTVAAAAKAAEHLAIGFGTPSALTAPGFTSRVAVQAQADRGLVSARFGTSAAGVVDELTAQAIARSVDLSHDGNTITLTAHWQSAAGAWALATATGQTLAANAMASSDTTALLQDDISLRMLPQSMVAVPVRDPAPAAAARTRLLETIGLGLMGGVLLIVVAVSWDLRQRRARPAHANTTYPSG